MDSCSKTIIFQDDAETQVSSPSHEKCTPQGPSPTMTLPRIFRFVATAALVTISLRFFWHTWTNSSGCHHHQHSNYPQHQQQHPFLSDSTVMNYRGSPHSVAAMNQVVSKSLFDFRPEGLPLQDDALDSQDGGQRMLDDQCLVNVTIETICDGCDDWIANSGLQEWPWCHEDLTEMTFTYSGCACGQWYTIDYEKSVWSNGTGHSSVVYECWEPDFVYNATDIPTEILCQDITTLGVGNPSIEYSQASEVYWIASNAVDPSDVLGEGITSVGQDYTISTGDSTVSLPDFINITFYFINSEGDAVTLQTNVFPSAFCPGYPDDWYRLGYANMNIYKVQSITAGTISTAGTLREDALWVKLTVDASASPVPVRLDEFNLLTNIYPELINLTDAVYDEELNGMTTKTSTRSSGSRTSIHSTTHLRRSPAGGDNTMEVMVGPFTIDLAWRTRYTFFTTIIASVREDNEALCNGFDFNEYIVGLG